MNPKYKYWLEDNKDKLYIGGAVLALVAVIGGSYWLTQRDRSYNVGEDIEVAMADYLLTQEESGELKTVKVKDGKSSASYELDKDALTFTGDNLSDMYVYLDDEIQLIEVDDKGQIELTNSIDVPELEEVSMIKTNGSKFGLLTPTELVVIDDKGKELVRFDDNLSDIFHVSDKGVYLGEANEIHFIDYEKQKTEYVDIGDKTTNITEHADTIVARNDFGSGNELETLLNIDDGSLHIDELKRVQSENKIELMVPNNDNQLAFIKTFTDKEDKITRQALATISITEESKEADDNYINLNDFTLPLETKEPFTNKGKAIRGFIYDEVTDGLRVIEMRNGREVSRLDTGDILNFSPIYSN